jgi:hypothetical protein
VRNAKPLLQRDADADRDRLIIAVVLARRGIDADEPGDLAVAEFAGDADASLLRRPV